MSDEVLWELPDSWQWTSIADLGDVVSGGTPSTKDPSYWNGEINWITPADLSDYNNKFIVRGAKSLTNEGLENSSAKLMPAGSVHFSSRAPIGYVVISQAEISTNQGFKSLIPAQGIFNEYIYYYLKSAKHIAEERAGGTTFKELSGKAFSQLPIPIAPSNEQYRIVNRIEEFFSELDKGIEYLRTAQEQLKVYRQSILKYAFEGKLTEEWREAHTDQLETADQLLEHIQQERENRYQRQLNEWEEAVKAWEENGKEDKKPSKPKKPEIVLPLTERDTVNLPELPEIWTWISLAHIKEFSMYGPRFSSKDYVDEGVAILRTTDVSDSGKVDWKNSPKLLISDDEYEKYKLVKGDLLITRTGSIGTISVFNDDRKAIAGAFLIHYRLATHINPWFIFYFLKSKRAQNHFYEKSTGSGRPNLNVPNIELLAIPFLSFEEQNKIVQILEEKISVLDPFEAIISETLKKVDLLRQSILKKAFSGHLLAQDPNDEPASILLERIRAERLALPKPTNKISTSRKKPRKKEVVDLIRVLESANTWLSAQDVFQECGINGIIDEEKTDTIEKLYLQLRNLEKENRIEIDRRGDEDWLRILPIDRS